MPVVSAPERKTEPILRVAGLRKQFPVKLGLFKRGAVSAVDDISFDVYPGETLGSWASPAAASRPRPG